MNAEKVVEVAYECRELIRSLGRDRAKDRRWLLIQPLSQRERLAVIAVIREWVTAGSPSEETQCLKT